MYDMRGEEAKRQAIKFIDINIPEPEKPIARKQKSSLKCPNCKSKELLKNGFQMLADGNKHQSYRCKHCDYAFTPLLSILEK